MLAERGALVIDADVLAREVVAPGTPGLQQVVEAFGTGILTADGELDRQALATIVFADHDALATLNAITHPLIAEHTAALMGTARSGQPIVHDVPLLVENKLAAAYDLVVVVLAEQETRVSRLLGRGMATEEAHRRISQQASDPERRAVADVIIDNNGSMSALEDQIDALWQRIEALG